MSSPRRSLAIALLVLAVAAAIIVAPFGPGPAIVARVTADTPEGQLELFLRAVEGGEVERARSLWVIPPAMNESRRSGLESRRLSTTEQLALVRPASHAIERVQWWGTCCMPHVIDTSRGAGGARYWVSFASAGSYVVDVFAIDTSWLYDGQPARGWAVRDVYPRGEHAIYFTWPEN